MVLFAVLTLLAIARAVSGRPIDEDAFYDLKNGLSPIAVSCLPATVPSVPRSHFRPLVDPDRASDHPNSPNPLYGRADAS